MGEVFLTWCSGVCEVSKTSQVALMLDFFGPGLISLWGRFCFSPSGGFALTSHGFSGCVRGRSGQSAQGGRTGRPVAETWGERNEFLEDWDGLGLGQFGVNTCFCGKMLGISTWCHFGSHMSSNPCGSSIHILFDEGDQTEDRKSTANCHHT